MHFYMYPAPGPLVTLPEAKNALSVTIFEDQPPFLEDPVAAEFVKLYRERATKAGLPDPSVETQSAGVVHRLADPRGRRQGDEQPRRQGDRAWLKAEQGRHDPGQAALRRPEQLRRRPDGIKQVQNGKWVVVWPKDKSAPGATRSELTRAAGALRREP